MIWHIWWMAIVGFAGIVVTGLSRALTRTWITTYRLQKSKKTGKISISMRLTKQGLKKMATDTLAHNAHAHEHGHHDTGPMKVFGFWIYLMSDCIIFATLFATYAVLVNGTAGGPAGKDIFELPFVLVETALLLFSSITYGMAAIAMYKN